MSVMPSFEFRGEGFSSDEATPDIKTPVADNTIARRTVKSLTVLPPRSTSNSNPALVLTTFELPQSERQPSDDVNLFGIRQLLQAESLKLLRQDHH